MKSYPFCVYFQPYLNVDTCKGLSAIFVAQPNSFIALGTPITPEAFMISGKNVPHRHQKKHRICQHKITPRILHTLFQSFTHRRARMARYNITEASDFHSRLREFNFSATVIPGSMRTSVCLIQSQEKMCLLSTYMQKLDSVCVYVCVCVL